MMSPIFRQRHQELALNEKPSNGSMISLQEDPLIGPHKISYRPGQTWDFEGCTGNAPIDIDLVMPPHRPRMQPENHRTSLFLSSETGPIRAKICRHALNRSFNLIVTGGIRTDVLVWVPSNFSGYITVSGTNASFSPSFVEQVMPNARLNHSIPRGWCGDEIAIETGGRVAFCVWDVLTRRAESEKVLAASQQRQKRDVWRRMFGGANSGAVVPAGKGHRPQTAKMWDWDFLIED
ncbi:hypothetical protein ACEPAI_5385 [Sanghuangporus weigelae]